MFMTGESGGALKPYLLIEDNTGKEYAILHNTLTYAIIVNRRPDAKRFKRKGL